ncbi:hypothetical protein Z957_05140 [Clostridium sp. K25]|uniref:siphovirus ReqiPepy6 Gp37-like family protein n=1 Tax=Clostridium sp. K25 TaxID=1443109 RepID=UPI0004D883E5|nr:siphovirus ReqiPepy6 Gp37-like family protein [Clostridium sp. K25]KEI09291.1 hypothetical protein Z957_05140 [Clostridium sp. K25]
MELYVFDKELNCLGIVEKFDSLIWRRKYYKTGNFELRCAATIENLELLKEDNIIYKKNGKEAAYINFKQLGLDITGKEVMVIRGNFLNGYLDRRIIWGRKIFDDTIENIIRNIILENCINPIDKNRIIPNLVLGNFKGFKQKINYQVSYKNVLIELENLTELGQLGHEAILTPKDKKITINIYKGLDRSTNQDVNSKCIFNMNFENVLSQDYSKSTNNYKNINLIAGAGEGAERKFTTVGEETSMGLNRYELFTDARDIQQKQFKDDKEIIIPKEQYLNMLKERGKIKLNNNAKVETFTSKINLNGNLKYKEDFDLGDIVTCINSRWGIKLDRRITEIEELYESSGLKLTAVFGTELPTLIDRIKDNFN